MKPVRWIGSSLDDLRALPDDVRAAFGFALYQVQEGKHPSIAKPLRGFGAGVLEMVDDFDGDTYRAVYAIRFPSAVYVLHVFQKKSSHGSKTARRDTDLIRARLARAAAREAAYPRTPEESST
ncbi:MAG: type II toxin-antitoxin system RelE/ParE family toxin [Chloroflexota bacterium]